MAALGWALAGHAPESAQEASDRARVEQLVATGRAWDRAATLHVTASALIVHPPTRRVLLRWHERQGSWLQVGGHADPGEDDPLGVALREATEETGLTDVTAWPDAATPTVVHLVIVPVPAGRGEPAHEHADIRYLLATSTPDLAVPETASARQRWLSVSEAEQATNEDNLRETLRRLQRAFDSAR